MRYLREEGQPARRGHRVPAAARRASATGTRSSSRAGPGHKRDLRIVRPYIRDFKPVLIGVDGGADALLEAGLQAGRDRRRHGLGLGRGAALRRGARRPRATADGTAPGAERARAARRRRTTSSPRPGISEDLALLLAYEKGAELIVAVGTHFNLIEFLERDRAGMSSTFVTRLKVGEILVDAKGVSRLVSRQRRASGRSSRFALAGLGAIVVAIAARRSCGTLIELLGLRLADLSGSAGADAIRGQARAARAARGRLGVLAEPHHLADWWPGIAGRPARTAAGSRRAARAGSVVARAAGRPPPASRARGPWSSIAPSSSTSASPSSSPSERLDGRARRSSRTRRRPDARAKLAVEAPLLLGLKPRRCRGRRSPGSTPSARLLPTL